MRNILFLIFILIPSMVMAQPAPFPIAENTEYDEGDTAVTARGPAVQGKDGSNTIRPFYVDATYRSGKTQIINSSGTIIDSFGGGTQYDDGEAVATPKGTVALGHDGTNARALDVDASGQLQIDVLTLPSVTIGTFPDNEPFNMAQIGGAAVSTSSGTLDAGTQRVAIATDDEVNNLLGTIDADTSTLAGTDFMLGTDFSAVLGSSSLILATQADDVVNTSDGAQVTNFNMVFDGTTWDRVRGDSANGLLVNLGSNNDVTEASASTIATNTGNSATSLAAMDDWDSTHDSPISADGAVTMLEYKDFDGSALPNNVGTEGDAVRKAGSAYGIQYFMLLNEDGTKVGNANATPLLRLASSSSDVDNTVVVVYDASAGNASTKFVKVTNAGDGALFCKQGGTDPVAPGSTADFDNAIPVNDHDWFDVGTLTGTTSDVECIRSAAQTNDNVIVSEYGYN